MQLDETARQALRCGWLPRSESLRSVGMRPFPEAETCPAYTSQMPDVIEAARALVWTNRGSLSVLYPPGVTPLLIDCVDILDGAVKENEREEFAKAKERG